MHEVIVHTKYVKASTLFPPCSQASARLPATGIREGPREAVGGTRAQRAEER